jgi:hypothetical protein
LAALPLSLLPYHLAGLLFTALSVAALILALRILGVRDWRCFALAFTSWPVLLGLRLGSLGPLLVLGLATAWRHRNRLLAPAAACASVIAAKLFPWLLLGWLVLTRRFRLLGATIVAGASLVCVAWAAIGFAGLSAYPRMLSNLAFVEAPTGVSPVSALLAAASPWRIAVFLALAAALVLMVYAGLLARRFDGDQRAFGIAITAALIASPVVWPHYLILLFVPIALISPRLSAIWYVPLLAWIAPIAQTRGHVWMMVPYLGIVAIVLYRLCAAGSRGAIPSSALEPLGRRA